MALILGLSCFYHDSAACLIKDGKILSAVQEERFSRIKNDPSFPSLSIRFCLEEDGATLSDIEAVVFYDRPFLKMERIFETHLDNAPFGLSSFLKSTPLWMGDKFNFRRLIKRELNKIPGKFQGEILFCDHHLSHAASSFYTSPFSESAVLTIDGVGEWATLSISQFEGTKVRLLHEMRFPNSIGLLYSAFTWYCGFKVNSGEYKLMGLAPYGNQGSQRVERYISLIKENIVTVYGDGSIFLNQEYFAYLKRNKMIDEARFERLFSLPRRVPESDLTQEYCDMAMAIQMVTEEIILKLARHTRKITDSSNLCLSGGVALNCVANGKIQRENIFDAISIHPAPGDAGGALGAALAYHHHQNSIPNHHKASFTPYLGPWFSDKEIMAVLKKNKVAYKRFDDGELFECVAGLIFENKICGWFQGRMEWGPRALGNRSILANPASQSMQRELNLKIKFRESFRPFAPVVLEEYAQEYFEGIESSPYMSFTYPVAKGKRVGADEGQREVSGSGIQFLSDQARSTVPAITHVDYSARVQTVNQKQNERLYRLIQEFHSKSNIPLLINTSFNIRGEPIVCTPEDALNCFSVTHMDVLVMNNYVVFKDISSRC